MDDSDICDVRVGGAALNGQSPPAVHACHVQLKPGDILVADGDANPNNIGGSCRQEHCLGVLFRVDPVMGEREIVTRQGLALPSLPKIQLVAP